MSSFVPDHISLSSANLIRFGLPMLGAWAIGAAGTWASIRLARGINALDRPVERSSHETPTPRLGGIGIALGLFATLAIFVSLPDSKAPDFSLKSGSRYLWALCCGGLFAFAFGLLDDVKQQKPLVKLLCQAICAMIAVVVGWRFKAIAWPGGQMDLGWLGAALTALWIVFFMNAFNFMDGMDGHTGGFGVMACAALAAPMLVGLERPDDWGLRAGTLLLLAGALLGFLQFNTRKPALTFMGDSGAQMTGFILALSVAGAHPVFVFSGLMALWPFIYDTAHTLAVRAARRQNLLEAHRDHLYQRLLKAGWSHRQSRRLGSLFHLACVAASVYYVVQAARKDGAPGQYVALGIVFGATAVYILVVECAEAAARKRTPGAE